MATKGIDLEIKSYAALKSWLSAASIFYAFLLFLLTYQAVLTPSHKAAILGVLAGWTTHPLLKQLPLPVAMAALAAAWGWISTSVLRLHDRLHEPRVFRWRASYDSDFILRALCHEHAAHISPQMFVQAYANAATRSQLMVRLFYNFVGDSVEYEGKRVFFYGVMLKYWVCALLEVYAAVALVGIAVYHLLTLTQAQPVAVLVLVVGLVTARLYANHVLDEAHMITLAQIDYIRQAKADVFGQALETTAKEFSFWREA